MKTFVGDFETTVYDGQDYTEVWASALVEIGSDNVLVHTSIDETFNYLKSLHCNCVVYYHNLKFDGAFWLWYLLNVQGFKQAIHRDASGNFVLDDKLVSGKVAYLISDMGTWYTVRFAVGHNFIELRDSLKLLPFSVKRIGKAFKTQHQKTSIEYKGERHAGGYISPQEREYIANDVLVVKEALEIMFSQGHNKLTIGACCLDEYNKTLSEFDREADYPDVYQMELDESYGEPTVGDYIHNAYKGGWCYLAKGKENKIYHNGITADVNSLYPSMMSSESGNRYPVGKPHFWKGEIPAEALGEDKYYFVRIRTRFYIKPNMLPCIQIKRNVLYRSTEWLETSDVWDAKHGKYAKFYWSVEGVLEPAIVTLTLTMTDFQLIKEHYNLREFEMLDGCWFWAKTGIFDDYIEKYKKIKLESKGALRELAKLFLNNLYGKMATSPISSFKYVLMGEDDELTFKTQPEKNKKAGYIPIGAAITSYARNFTIRAAQKNYHGVNAKGFIYADTDSIHCNLDPEDIQGIKVDDRNFCCWKLEASWDIAKFVRQKTYMEHVVAENLSPIDIPYWNIKCAGLPERCKKLYQMSMDGNYTQEQFDSLTEEEKEFVKVKRTMNDFGKGLKIPSKLVPKQIKGGVVLVETTYEMR